MAEMISIAMETNSDGAWRRAARVALLLIAGLTASAAPRSPFSAPAPAAAAIGAVTRVGQTPDPDTGTGDTGGDGDDEAQPIPVIGDTPKATPPDTASVNAPLAPTVSAPADSAAFLPVFSDSAPPDTLRYVPPGERPARAAAGPRRPGDAPAPIVKKPKQGLFGLPPIVLILGLTVVHVFVVQAVTD